jgi:hypothetical protein
MVSAFYENLLKMFCLVKKEGVGINIAEKIRLKKGDRKMML